MKEPILGIAIFVPCKHGWTNPRTGECHRCSGTGEVMKKITLEDFAELFSYGESHYTERLTLRLKPEVMQLLYSLSTEIAEGGGPKTYASTIEAALHALSREMDAEVKAAEDE